MTLQTMLDAARDGSAHVEEGWGQGRATYGGLVAGIALSAMKGAQPDLAPLRSLTVSFVGPVAPGPVDVEVTTLRAGSRATQMQALLRQDGSVVTAVLASFGASRESVISITPTAVMPDLADPETLEPLPSIPGVTPDFFAHVDVRYADGSWPYSGADSSHMSGWMRFRESLPRFAEEHLVSLVDAWPPTVIQMLTEPRPASSLTWTIELVSDLDELAADPGTRWGYAVRTDAAADGYAHTHAHVWHPDGRLVAISRQTVAVFA